MTDERKWTTGTLARVAGICVETVRAYERRGIVTPTRDETGRRLFTNLDLEKINEYRRERQRRGLGDRR